MFGAQSIDTAIGLVFIYFILSLACSAVSEAIANLLALRARTLKEGLATLLFDPKLEGIAKAFYEHPLIQGISGTRLRLLRGTISKVPSYIPSSTFAIALIDEVIRKGRAELEKKEGAGDATAKTATVLLLSRAPGALASATAALGSNAPGPDAIKALLSTTAPPSIADLRIAIANLPEELEALGRTLAALLDEGVKDLESAKRRVSDWFDASMERVSGWYKRQAHAIIIVIAAAVAVVGNVDSIRIVKGLTNNATLRASLVAAADEAVKKPVKEGEKSNAELIASVTSDIKKLDGVPIGWPKRQDGSSIQGLFQLEEGETTMLKILGLLLTIFAVSLGAPFWFDLLNRIVNLRAVGRTPGADSSAGGRNPQAATGDGK